MELPNATTRSPSPTIAYSMLELKNVADGIDFVFLYNGTRFFIEISATDLGDGEVLNRLIDFRDDMEDPIATYEFEEWVFDALSAFLPAFKDHSSRTLLEFYSPPTLAFKMVNRSGKLYPVRQDYDPLVHGDTTPRTCIVDDLSNDASLSVEEHCFQGVISRSSLPPVPLIPASQIELVTDGMHDADLMQTPQKVRHIGHDGPVLFFKPGSKDHGHIRELEVLSQINQSNKYAPPLRTSRLVALVVWDHDTSKSAEYWMGFLLEYTKGETLENQSMYGASESSKSKWIRQVHATMEQLHRDGIVWGDVKPDNVLINEDDNAVVVDFGGGYTPGYIKPELQQTKEGDLMGLRHMAGEIGISI